MSPVHADATFAISVFDAACAAIAAGCAVYVALRDSRWRKNGLAKRLEDSVREANDKAERWHDSPEGKKMREDIDGHGRQLAAHTSSLANVATKTDLAKVEGMVRATEASAKAAAAGVDRIESILLKNALSPAGR